MLQQLFSSIFAWAGQQPVPAVQGPWSPWPSAGSPAISVAWQHAFRVAWCVVAVLAAYVLATGMPLLYATAATTTALTIFDRDVLGLTPTMAQVWHAWGLPTSSYGYAIVFTRLAFVLSFVTVSAIIIWRKPNHIVAVIVAFFLLTFTVSSAVPQTLLVQRVPLAYVISEIIQAVSTVLILPVLYLFPNGRFVTRWSKALLVPWCLLHVAWLFIPSLPFNPIYGATWERTFVLSLVFAECWYTSGFVVMLYRYQRLASPTEKQQMRWVVITWCVSFCFGLLYIAVPVAVNQTGANLDGWPRLAWNLGFYALVGFVFSLGAVAFAIAILRHRLWDVDRLFSRAARYLLASLIVVLVCMLAALSIGSIIRIYAGPDNPLTLSVYAVVATLLFNPVRRHVQRIIDRRFDRTYIDAAHAVTHFAREAHTIVALPDLLRLLMTHAVRLFQARSGAILLFDETGVPRLAHIFNWHTHDVAELLNLTGEHVYTHTLETQLLHQPSHLPFLLPLTALKIGRPTQIGFLALGPRLSEQAYTRRDADLLRDLAEHASAAIAVSQLLEVQRQTERYRHTPAGQAETLIAQWNSQPVAALDALDVLSSLHTLGQQACEDSLALAKLEALSVAAMNANAPTLRLLAEGYSRLLEGRTDDAMLSVGLRQIIAALAQLQAHASVNIPDLPAVLAFHRLLLHWLSVQSISHITHLLTEWYDLNRITLPVPSPHLPLMNLLRTLIPVAEALAKSERCATAQDKLCYLDEAHERLLMQTATITGIQLPLDALIFSRMQHSWMAALKQGIHLLRGQADLKLDLQTHHVIHTAHMGLVVEVTNHGLSEAEAVHLELMPGTGYACVECCVVWSALAPGCTTQASFVIAADQATEQGPQLEAVLLTLRLRLSYTESHALQQQQLQQHQREVSLQLQVLHPPLYQRLVANPYCAGPPLSANSSVFMGREEELDCVARAVSQGHAHFMLIGPRRMGKTSMLKNLGAQLGNQFIAVFWDGQRLGLESGMAGFFYDAACETATALEMPLPTFEQFAAQPAHFFEAVFLPQVLQALQGRRLLVLFDEIEEMETRTLTGRIDEAIFAWLRHIMQHQPRITFVFAAAHEPSHLNARLWSSAMNNVLSQRVGHLSPASTRTLITQPTSGQLFYDDLALDHLQRLVAGHPFFTQLFCHILVDQANQHQRSFVLVEHVRAALPTVLERGSGQLSDIWRTCTEDEQAVLQALESENAMAADTLCAEYALAVRALFERELIAAKLNLCGEPTYVCRLGLLQAYVGTKRYPNPRSF